MLTYGYQHCIDGIDLDWIGHATDEEITNCFNDLINAGIIPGDLKAVSSTELQRFWLIYWLDDAAVPYPSYIKDEASYSYYCNEQERSQVDDSADDTTPF